MFYVYLLRSEMPSRRNLCRLNRRNLRRRLGEHNVGKSIHTNKFKPWVLNGVRRAARETSRGTIRKISEERIGPCVC